MLQIRLRKGSSGDRGGGEAAEPVTVACPVHLVLADLPVAKGIGVVTASTVATTLCVGRRSRHHLGEKVHFCVRCNFSIAIYGRLFPCEHIFCLTCARNDSSCYICEERIQKIQSIKMTEEIFICGAPHCYKSFLKQAELESHINETHLDLLQSQVNKEGGNETSDAFNMARPSSADTQKQSLLPGSSSAHAPLRPDLSPSSSSGVQDHEERTYRHQLKDQQPPRPPIQPNLTLSHSQRQPNDLQAKNNRRHGSERPSNWYHHPQNFGSQSVGPQYQQGSDQFPPDKPAVVPHETSLSNYPPLPQQPPNYLMPMNANQAPAPTQSICYPLPRTERAQPYYNAPYEVQQLESGSEQGSVSGIPPVPTGTISFPDNCPHPWGMGLTGVPFQHLPVGQGIPEGFMNPTCPQGGVPLYQLGDFGPMPGMPLNPPLPSKESDLQGCYAGHSDGKGVLVPLPAMSVPPPPPPPPPPALHPSQLPSNRAKFSSPNDSSQDG